MTLSREQVYRLVAGVPERLSLTTLAALCDILACTPGDLVEPSHRGQPAGRSEPGAGRPGRRPRRARVLPGGTDADGERAEGLRGWPRARSAQGWRACSRCRRARSWPRSARLTSRWPAVRWPRPWTRSPGTGGAADPGAALTGRQARDVLADGAPPAVAGWPPS